MAMQHTRVLSKIFNNRRVGNSLTTLTTLSRRCYERDGEVGTPNRPGPFNGYFYPKSQEYWSKEYPSQSESSDEYTSEEVYLDEIEARLRKYDKKYRMSDEKKRLYNQYGWEDQDDRAFATYGGGLSGENDELQYGRGKKINPAQYINGESMAVRRQAIPPVEYLTPEQIRRSRGSLSSFRELPPETPSIWKQWNIYTTGLVFGALCVTKEFFILGGHDMWDAILYWSIFGVAGSVIADSIAWLNALTTQEAFDREYFVINEKAKQLNEQIAAYATRPDDRAILLGLMAYRETLSEKVLQRTLSNRISRLADSANKRLNDKLGEEASVRKDAESGWQKEALENTLNYFEDSKVRQQFMADAVKQFCAPGAASLKQSSTTTNPSVELFQNKYKQFYQTAQTNYMNSNKKEGTLSWVFVDAKERAKLRLSKTDKESEFTKRIKSWEQSHNPVNSQMPAFA